MTKITPEELSNSGDFELLAEVEHRNIKQFVLEQIIPGVHLIRWYSHYQVAMILLFILLLVKAFILLSRGMNEALWQIGGAVLFSFTILIFIHESIHALTFWLCGAKNIKARAMLRKFIFYVMADRQVVDYSTYRLVAYAPLVAVKLCCIILGIFFWSSGPAYFFFSVMCIHSLFCAGDIAMLAFYKIHADKEIYSFDDIKSAKSFFYYRVHH